MNPSTLIDGGGLFLAAFAVHWIWWRTRGVPSAPALSLSLHFLAFAAAYACYFPAGRDPAELLFYVALAAAYIQTMPLMMLRSPTLQILLELGQAGPAGLTREELSRTFDAQALFSRRLVELEQARLIERAPDGRLRSRLRGKLCVPTFLVMRRVLGLPTGNG